METKSKEAMVVKFEWLQDAIENDYTAEEWQDLAKMLIEYGNGNYDYVPAERINKKGAKNILDCIKYNNDKYASVSEANSSNGKAGGVKSGVTRHINMIKRVLEEQKQIEANASFLKRNEADTDTDTGTDTDTDSVTIEDISPIVVVDKNNDKPLLAKVPVKQQCDSTGFEVKNFSPVEVVKNFDNGNLPYKSVLITAYKVFSSHTGTNDDKYRKSAAECDNEPYWKPAVTCVYFAGADIASILKVGVAIDNVIKLVGKQPAMKSVYRIMQNICGKHKDKPIDEKMRILIGSINNFEKDCK